jgi:hypothetical protein
VDSLLSLAVPGRRRRRAEVSLPDYSVYASSSTCEVDGEYWQTIIET